MKQIILLTVFAIVISSTNGDGNNTLPHGENAEDNVDEIVEENVEENVEKNVEVTTQENMTSVDGLFRSSSGCSYKVSVGCAECGKGSHKEEPKIYEDYYAQPGQVGGKAHYKSSDGYQAIWYYKSKGQWIIGQKNELGTDQAHAYVSSSASCPYTPAYTWRFYNQDLRQWYDADKTLSIWSKSRK